MTRLSSPCGQYLNLRTCTQLDNFPLRDVMRKLRVEYLGLKVLVDIFRSWSRQLSHHFRVLLVLSFLQILSHHFRPHATQPIINGCNVEQVILDLAQVHNRFRLQNVLICPCIRIEDLLELVSQWANCLGEDELDRLVRKRLLCLNFVGLLKVHCCYYPNGCIICIMLWL